MRLVFGCQGLVLLFVAVLTIWDAATKHSFTVFKLHPSGSPSYLTLSYATSPHMFYWAMLILYFGICLGVGVFYTHIAYAATFRSVIPNSERKKHELT